MLFHVSIDAEDPRHVAQVIAEFWGGIAVPFHPVMTGSWMAMAQDARNTTVEVYPRGTELAPGDGDADPEGRMGAAHALSSTHFAMATEMGADAVRAIAEREGWPVKYRKRGGLFGVMEIWIEGTRMIEVLTPEMQAEYRALTAADANRLPDAAAA